VSDGWQRLLQFKLLRMDGWAGMKEPWYLMDRLDSYYYELAAKFTWWTPTILGTDVRALGLRLTLDTAMLGVGGLMGMRVATSCLLGSVLNFAVLAPIMIQRGEISAYTNAAGVLVPVSRGEIVNQWSLWWAVTMMVVGSLVGLFAKPEIFRGLFRRAAPRAAEGPDVLAGIELPLIVSWIGVPVLMVAGAGLSHAFPGCLRSFPFR
jgi:hypothetical protein